MESAEVHYRSAQRMSPLGLMTELDTKPNKTVFEEITGGHDGIELGKRKVASRAYVSWFNFKSAAQQRRVGTLSGGACDGAGSASSFWMDDFKCRDPFTEWVL